MSYEKTKSVLRWVPVTEKLPDDNRRVLVCTKGGKPFIAHYDQIWKRWRVSYNVTIAYWMDLPDLPEEV